ncbi:MULTISPECIES: DUF1684 domain-containing protein [unclassified Lysobacter]|uniref:DUF1684 domain-containing protein n=1 Tax=unclassified Lysobacter TaxID=2635362 RepID=UPI001C2473D1|nr:DUF1684 domain-containing protein [Lysobacter sp. MMG2]MBU8974900.1 DUF1684 domain-containing protein [Lysobacter sp. MMG2]
MSAVAKGKLVSRMFAVMMIGTLAACGSQKDDAATAEQAKAAQASFQNELDMVRQQRVVDLTRADGWTSLIGLHWIEPGAHYIGSSAGNGIKLSMGPSHFGMIDLQNNTLRFVPEKGAAMTLDGQPLTGATVLRADDAPTGPSVIAFDEGKGMATVIKRGDRYLLRVKHADAATRTGFRGLEYWPTSRDWRVEGRFVPHPAGKTLEIANIIGTTDAVPNPGAIEFERDGKTYRIEALDEGEETLFLVFADRTSGHGSYPAGRFLDVAKPGIGGKVVLDFNQARNPPCAFTAFATCPLPPPENRLDVAIQAGEKTYTHSAP